MSRILKIATVIFIVLLIIAVVAKLIQLLLPVILVLILIGYIYSKFKKTPVEHRDEENKNYRNNNAYESEEDKYSNKEVIDVEYKDIE